MPAMTYKNLMEQMFFEKLSSDPRSQAHQQALKQGLKHLGGGSYGKELGQPATHKIDDTNKLVVIPPEEREKPKDASRPTPAKKSAGAGAPAKKIPASTPASKPARAQSTYSTDDFSNDLKSRLDVSLSKFNKSAQAAKMEATLGSDFRRFYGRLNDIAKMSRGPKRRAQLEDLIGNFNVIMGNGKIYANHFTKNVGLYKVFGDRIGKDAQFFLDMAAQEGIDLTQSTDKKESAKQYLAGQSKPNYGKPHRYDDPNVRELFTSNPVLDDLEPRYKSVFGPTGADGSLMRSGGKNAKSYFEHSVNSNVGVDKTITELNSFAERSGQRPDDVTGYAGVAKSLQTYRANMKVALSKFDAMPPKAREELVGQVYAKLAHDMHMADAEVASSIMKNMAEMALYDSEIAAGHEAYLPSEGTFPTGDKIVVTRNGTKVERIETISVKYGKNSARSYGMPGEASKVCLYHPDPKMRDLLDSRAGRIGYEVGISGNIIHDESNFRNFTRMSGFDKCFDKDQLDKLRQYGVEMTLITKKFKKNHPNAKSNGELPAGQLGGLENDAAMQKAWAKVNKMLKTGNQENLTELLGEYNYRQMLKPGKNAMVFYSMLAFGAAVRTSDGFPTVLHNHQEYSDGQFISETDVGSNQLRDWQTMFTPYGDRAGGLKVGFNRRAAERPSRKSRSV